MSEIEFMSPYDLTPHVLHEHIYGAPADDDTFEDLMNDIKANGMVQPIVTDQNYIVLSGSRRLKAALELGMEQVPVDVRTFNSEQAVIQSILSFNEYRVKTKLQRVREGIVYQEMLKKILETKKENRDLRDGQLLNAIASADGKVVTRDAAGNAVGLSPRTLQTGKKVVETIDELKEEGREEEAAAIEEKAKTSIDGAAKMADEAKPKAEVAKSPQDILYWYVSSLRRISVGIRSQADAMRKKTNSTTPAGFSYFLENLDRMADRVDSWMPDKMTDCPICHGTMSINGQPCSMCIQGKTGLFRVPDDVVTKAPEDPKVIIRKPIYCEECGDLVGYDNHDGPDLVDPETELIDGAWVCKPCARERAAE